MLYERLITFWTSTTCRLHTHNVSASVLAMSKRSASPSGQEQPQPKRVRTITRELVSIFVSHASYLFLSSLCHFITHATYELENMIYPT